MKCPLHGRCIAWDAVWGHGLAQHLCPPLGLVSLFHRNELVITCGADLAAGVADLFRLDPTVAYGTPIRLPRPPTIAVPKSIFSADVTVKVFTRNPGYGLHVIPRETGSLLNLAAATLRPTRVWGAHPRDMDAPDRSYSGGEQRRRLYTPRSRVNGLIL